MDWAQRKKSNKMKRSEPANDCARGKGQRTPFPPQSPLGLPLVVSVVSSVVLVVSVVASVVLVVPVVSSVVLVIAVVSSVVLVVPVVSSVV